MNEGRQCVKLDLVSVLNYIKNKLVAGYLFPDSSVEGESAGFWNTLITCWLKAQLACASWLWSVAASRMFGRGSLCNC